MTEAYPVLPDHPGHMPTYGPQSISGERATLKQEWEYVLLRHKNCLNMNTALKNCFLSLIETHIVKTYKNVVGLLNPNCAFIQLLNWFTTRYAMLNEAGCSQNKANMETFWNAGDGFEALIAQINEGIIFVDITDHTIDASEVVDVAVRVMMRSSIFTNTYKA